MKPIARSTARRHQRGGFFIGLVVGLLIGLAAALGVALYVTKAPNPFVNKVPGRSAVQDAAEAEKNRSWDPNSALAGRNPAPSGAAQVAPTAPVLPVTQSPPALVAPIVIDPLPAPAASAPVRTARASSPATGTTTATTATGGAAIGTATIGADPFSYFVQAGAFARSEDAEQQRAKLALLGVESRLTEREQAGRSVYRVRVGPFERKEEADAAKDKLGDAGVDSALVRVQK